MIGQAERLLELNRLSKTARLAGKAKPKVFAFTSGKGGTGKTFLTLNTAYALSSIGRKVLVIDLDANFSNSSIMLNVYASKTIYGFYSGQSFLDELITEVEPGFDFIFGDSGKVDYESAGHEKINQFFGQLQQLENKYDFIFFDTGAGASAETLNFISRADVNLIVTTPEPTAVMDAYVMLKLLNHEQFRGSKYLIVNRCSAENDAHTTHNNFNAAAKHFLNDGAELLGGINSDELVSRSIIDQELFLISCPESRTAQQIRAAALSLTEIVRLAGIKQKQIG